MTEHRRPHHRLLAGLILSGLVCALLLGLLLSKPWREGQILAHEEEVMLSLRTMMGTAGSAGVTEDAFRRHGYRFRSDRQGSAVTWVAWPERVQVTGSSTFYCRWQDGRIEMQIYRVVDPRIAPSGDREPPPFPPGPPPGTAR